MKGSESSSASSTVATPPNEQQSPLRAENSGQPARGKKPGDPANAHDNPDKPKTASEAEFLTQQADDAKAALAATWGELTHALKSTGDIALWAKRYPWITTGAAAVAGFVASVALVPATKKEAQEKWEHLKSAVSGTKHAGVDAVEIDGQRIEVEPEGKKAAAGQGVLGAVLAQLFGALRPMITSLIASKFGSGNGADAGQTNGDSHQSHAS